MRGEQQEIRPIRMEELEDAYRLLIASSFPPEERKPLRMIRQALARDAYRCYGAYLGGSLAACVFFAVLREARGSYWLLDYLSVREDLRGQGIGSALLERLLSGGFGTDGTILLEVDDPDAAEGAERLLRQRRRSFYLRNGLLETGVRAHVYGVDYRILRAPGAGTPDDEETASGYAALYRSFLPAGLFARHVSVRTSSARAGSASADGAERRLPT